MHKAIEQRLRDHFPILFNQTTSFDQKEYRREFKTFIDDAISVSNPILGAEAIRYQSILLYVSLAFAAVYFLDIKHLKFVDVEVAVSRELFIIYAGFIGLISLAFSCKAWFDFQRWNLIRRKHSDAAENLQELVGLGLARKQLENHYWGKTFDMIGQCYEPYSAAQEKVLVGYKDVSIQSSAALLDINSLNLPAALKPVIAIKETWLRDLQSELKGLTQAFEAECEPILLAHEAIKNDPSPFQSDDSYNRITAAFDKWLEPWFIARNSLMDELFSRSIRNFDSSEEQQMLKELIKVFAQLKSMRILYVTAEIIFPVLFALFTAALMFWSHSVSSVPA
jgi:hypothetical protein